MKITLPVSLALTFSIVLQAHAATSLQAMVARWGFDEVNGMTAIDSLGRGNDATLVNDAERSKDTAPTGITNRTSLGLTGKAYATAPHINFNNRSFTVATWLKTTDMSEDQVLLSQGDSSKTGKNLVLRVTPSGRIDFSFNRDDNHTEDGIIQENKWYHVAFTFDTNTRQRRIYVDGTMLVNGTSSGVYLGQTGLTQIGRMNVEPFGDDFWQGNIDDLSVYSVALTGDEIGALATVSPDAKAWSSSSSSSRRTAQSSSARSNPGLVAPQFQYHQLSLVERLQMRTTRTIVKQVPKASSSSSSAGCACTASSSSVWRAPVVRSSSSSSTSSVWTAPAAVSSSSVWTEPSAGMRYQVTSFQLHLRTDSRASATNIRTLMPHTQLTVWEMLKNGWAKVQTDDGVVGYVNASFIEQVR